MVWEFILSASASGSCCLHRLRDVLQSPRKLGSLRGPSVIDELLLGDLILESDYPRVPRFHSQRRRFQMEVVPGPFRLSVLLR